MRWSLLLLLVAIPRLAFAEPKVAVAPLDDDDGKIAEIVGDAVSERAKLTKPGRVEGAMRSMGVSVLSAKSLKKLRAKLDVDVVIYGSVEKSGGTKHLSLTFAGSSKTKPTLELDIKSPTQLKKDLGGKLGKRIAAAMEGDGGDEDDEEEAEQREAERKREEERRAAEERKRKEEEERKREEEQRAERKRREDEDRKREEEDRKRKKRGDDDDDRADRKKRGDDDDRKRDDDDDERSVLRKSRDDDDRKGDRKKDRDDDRKKRVADEDEDDDGGRARKRLGDEDEADEEEDQPRKKKRRTRRHVLTQNALWLDGGAAVARRTLTYSSTGMMKPPRVGVAAASGRLEGELYPAAFSSLKGPIAGLGLNAVMGYTVGLGIAVPNTTVTAPIKNAHMAIGARYRFVFGEHSVAAGISYWRRYFLADRTGLMNPALLDMPDVDYKAIAPGVAARIAVTPTIAAFATVDFPLMLNSGPIQEPKSYGSAKILAFDARGGAQIIVADHVALQVAAELMQVGLSFTGQPGSMASTRMVSSATDRSIGISATVGITY